MAEETTKSQSQVVALDGDKLGHIAGAVVALVIMAVSFYYREVDAATAFTRVGWAFVLAYGATYFLVRVILRVTLFLVIAEKKRVLHEKRTRIREQRSKEAAARTVKTFDEEEQEEA